MYLGFADLHFKDENGKLYIKRVFLPEAQNFTEILPNLPNLIYLYQAFCSPNISVKPTWV